MTFWLTVLGGAAVALALIVDLWVREQDDSEPDYDGWWSDD